jgi:hypothetical protein
MKVKLKRPFYFGSENYAPGVDEPADEISHSWFFQSNVNEKNIEILELPKTEIPLAETPKSTDLLDVLKSNQKAISESAKAEKEEKALDEEIKEDKKKRGHKPRG